MILKIGILTGSRSEFGLLKALISDIISKPDMELVLITTGFHNTDYGSKELREYFVSCHAEMYRPGEENMHLMGFGRGAQNLSKCLKKTAPDALVVVGDRLEALAGAVAASVLNIPVCQIQAGDKTDSGHIDEATRFAISQFSSLMFTANESHRERLIRMGEDPSRVFVTGSINIDAILKVPKLTREKVFEKHGLDPEKKTALLLYHPITTESSPEKNFGEILKFLETENIQVLTVYPNMDWGSDSIVKKIKSQKDMVAKKSLDYTDYIQLMRTVDFLIGNSSSGLIEGPTTHTPVINVGPRNRGRDHGCNVVFCDANTWDLKRALNTLQSGDFQKALKNCTNPYGDGGASQKIIKALRKLPKLGIWPKKRSY